MPWCPNCKTEYCLEIKACADCGAELVEALPEQPGAIDLGGPVFLLTAADDAEAGMYRAMLEEARIPVLCKHQSGGQGPAVILGSSCFGVDLYVPEARLEAAKAIVQGEREISDEEENEDEEQEETEKKAEKNQWHDEIWDWGMGWKTRRGVTAWILLIGIVSGVFLSVVSLMWWVWSYFFR